MMTRRLSAVRARLLGEILRFGVVGAVGYVSDVGIFNLLRVGFGWNPLYAKAVSLTVSTTVAYFGNRFWTYRERPAARRTSGQYVLFYAINGVGAVVELSVLWFSHYVLGFHSALADNVSGNVIGMVVSTLFRFWGYRTLVFRLGDVSGEGAAEAATLDTGTLDAGTSEAAAPDAARAEVRTADTGTPEPLGSDEGDLVGQ